jgi:hypothetical protein
MVEQRCQCAFKILVQQLVKSMSWTVPVQDFPRPIIEHRLHALDLVARDTVEVCAGREELTQHSIGVLVCAALPRILRMGKAYFHLGLLGEQAMFPHFLPLAHFREQRSWAGNVLTSRAKAGCDSGASGYIGPGLPP